MRISLLVLCAFLCSSLQAGSSRLKRCYKKISHERLKVVTVLREIGIEHRREIPVPIHILVSYFYYQGKNEGLLIACDILKRRRKRRLPPFMIEYKNPMLDVLELQEDLKHLR